MRSPRPCVRKPVALSTIALAGVVLAGCSTTVRGSAQPATPGAATTASVAPGAEGTDPEQGSSDSPAAADSSSAPSGTASAPAGAEIPGAYPGAGGSLPANAVPITYHIIASPSGNLVCELDSANGVAGCGALSYIQEQKYGVESAPNPTAESPPRWWFDFSGTAIPTPTARGSEWSNYDTSLNPSIMQVPYVTVVHGVPFVCASAETGMTCWNTTTGRGVHLNKAGATGF